MGVGIATIESAAVCLDVDTWSAKFAICQERPIEIDVILPVVKNAPLDTPESSWRALPRCRFILRLAVFFYYEVPTFVPFSSQDPQRRVLICVGYVTGRAEALAMVTAPCGSVTA